MTAITPQRGQVSGPTVELKVHFRTGSRGRKRLRRGHQPDPPAVEPGRIPRIARLLALAHHMVGLIRRGTVRDHAHLARLGQVSRTRITQIMNLLNLAPDIQEEILFLPRVERGRDIVTERQMRRVTAHRDWTTQRQRWADVKVGE